MLVPAATAMMRNIEMFTKLDEKLKYEVKFGWRTSSRENVCLEKALLGKEVTLNFCIMSVMFLIWFKIY